MAYDLRFEPWLPVVRASGAREWIAPFELTDRMTVDPVVTLACPRADFDGAVLEFLVGLLSVALAPRDEDAWADLSAAPPDAAALRAALSHLPAAFDLDGDGPRAFQDLDPLGDVEPIPIDRLLIDAAGEQGVRLNKDVFVKRDRVGALGRPAAAMVVITMQTYAPAGGAGHRTSLRGGGPLTTLADPRAEPLAGPLWTHLWANVDTLEELEERDSNRTAAWRDADRFPWLAATRTSDEKAGGRATTPKDVAPEQCYFGLPRRVRLEFAADPGPCALTGRVDAVRVARFRMQNYGTQYLGWQHPLTPHYAKGDGDWLPRHGQPGGVGWRDWIGLLVGSPDDRRRPARCIARFTARRAQAPFRVRAFGYDMDNMKARGWLQAELPGLPADALERTRRFATAAVESTELAAFVLARAAKTARSADGERGGDASALRQRVWAATQAPFFELMQELASAGTDGAALRERFRQQLRRAVLAAFDDEFPLDVAVDAPGWRRQLVARRELALALEGVGKLGAKLYAALDLASPEIRSPRRKAK